MRIVFPKIIFGFKTRERNVCLTFDDGPHPVYTPQLLDILADSGVRATFFITGNKIKKYKNIVKRMISEGHEVANHGYSHRNLLFKNTQFIKNEIEKTDDLLRKCGAEGEIVFRPPFGRISLKAFCFLGKINKKIIMWNIPTKDFKAKSTDSILKKIYAKLRRGGIIVLHDAGKNIDSDVDRIHTVNAVKHVVVEILKRNYSFATISEMLESNS